MEQKLMTYVRPTLFFSAFVVMFSGAQPIYHPQNECSSKDCENVYQVLREFRMDIEELKHSIKQMQKKELGLVVVEMTPMILYSRLDNTSKIMCSIHNRGNEWSAVIIFQQNTTGSYSLLDVSRDGKVESRNARINGSMTASDDIINVTVSFDVRRGPGVCELNKTYFCDIQLVDTSINTKAGNSTFILETPPPNLTVETMPDGYVYYGNINETINCTGKINPNTTLLSLIGKRAKTLNEYFVTERKNVQTFVDSENNISCYPIVQTAFRKLGYFLENYNWVGCLAIDTISGQSSMTEFKYISVNIVV